MSSKKILDDIGIDAMLADAPIDRFEESKVAQKSPVQSAAQSAEKPGATPPPAKQASISHGSEGTASLLQDVKTLNDLKTAMAVFDGCSLKKTAMNLVFSDGNPEADVMLIGEAPGADEDRQGKPFVGQSGQLLRRIFSFTGLTLDKLYISNVLPYRPRQPTAHPHRSEHVQTFLEKHIELVNPKCVILVGGTSCKALLSTKEGITKIRGKWVDLTHSNSGKTVKAMATYHPAYLLRSPSRKREVWQDMLTLKDFLAES